jgi:hypothetical protein
MIILQILKKTVTLVLPLLTALWGLRRSVVTPVLPLGSGDIAPLAVRYPPEGGRLRHGSEFDITTLRSVLVTFAPDGGVEVAVEYERGEEETPANSANSGTKWRTQRAARMATRGLEMVLDDLRTGEVVWGGFPSLHARSPAREPQGSSTSTEKAVNGRRSRTSDPIETTVKKR